ncbi:MAG: RsmE family RNA methyltransferase [Candidatus Omnitrophota bacterium]
MSKVRLYLEPGLIKDELELKGKDYIHRFSDILRLKKKESISVFDGCGREFSFLIISLSKKGIVLKRQKLERSEKKEPREVILGFPLMREGKIDYILQKATELGVSAFIPFIASRSLVKTGGEKIERWRRIIIEAARQSDRLWLPKIEESLAFNQLIKRPCDLRLFAQKGGADIYSSVKKHHRQVLIIVGPEGDLSPQEIMALKQEEFAAVSLSLNILRSETAAIFAAGMIRDILDRFDSPSLEVSAGKKMIKP